VFLLWQIITSLGILVIADEIGHKSKKISRRFENCHFSKLGSALMTQIPIDVFIELISLLYIFVDFKVTPRVTRMIAASVFDTFCLCRADFFPLLALSDRLVFVEHHVLRGTKSSIDFPRCTPCPFND